MFETPAPRHGRASLLAAFECVARTRARHWGNPLNRRRWGARGSAKPSLGRAARGTRHAWSAIETSPVQRRTPALHPIGSCPARFGTSLYAADACACGFSMVMLVTLTRRGGEMNSYVDDADLASLVAELDGP